MNWEQRPLEPAQPTMTSWTKIIGIGVLLLVVCVVTAVRAPEFLNPYNLQNIILRTSLYGIISIGVAFVIISGGIDLSIGSVIGLVGCVLPMLLAVDYLPGTAQLTVESVDAESKSISVSGDLAKLERGDRLQLATGRSRSPRQFDVEKIERRQAGTIVLRTTPRRVEPGDRLAVLHMQHMNVALAIGLVLLLSLGIGLAHGLLVTKLRLQPFVVTLCGLLIYRGIARRITQDSTQGFGEMFDEGLRKLATGRLMLTGDFGIPIPFLILVALAIAAAVLLNKTVYGRHLLAVGKNEQAARFSGINTDATVIVAYVICALTAGIGGILFALYLNTIQPSSHGEFYELYAIAAAVLGGCSLRGGEGTILGVVIGAALMRVLYNSINLQGISTTLEFAIIGGVILAGVTADELLKRFASARRTKA